MISRPAFRDKASVFASSIEHPEHYYGAYVKQATIPPQSYPATVPFRAPFLSLRL